MARRRYGRRRRGRGGFKLPILSLAILAGQAALANSQSSTLLGKLDVFQSFYTGFVIEDKRFIPQNLAVGYAPWLAKRFIMPIARPRVPFRGVPFSLS